jgi:hypothetical protein
VLSEGTHRESLRWLTHRWTPSPQTPPLQWTHTAERWVEVAAPGAELLRWYSEQLVQMGWILESGDLREICRFTRDGDERMSVWATSKGGKALRGKFAAIAASVFGDDEAGGDSGVESTLRVTMAVTGRFPDGTDGPRIG